MRNNRHFFFLLVCSLLVTHSRLAGAVLNHWSPNRLWDLSFTHQFKTPSLYKPVSSAHSVPGMGLGAVVAGEGEEWFLHAKLRAAGEALSRTGRRMASGLEHEFVCILHCCRGIRRPTRKPFGGRSIQAGPLKDAQDFNRGKKEENSRLEDTVCQQRH